MVSPIVVYVPLTMQNVAKYRTWLLSATVSRSLKSQKYEREKNEGSPRKKTYKYPIPPREHPIHMKIPLLCSLSDAYESETRMTAATAYGGTVSS
jgi:hypothetical protein